MTVRTDKKYPKPLCLSLGKQRTDRKHGNMNIAFITGETCGHRHMDVRGNLSVLPASPRAAWRLKKQAAQPCAQGEPALAVTAEEVVDENSNSASAIMRAIQMIVHQRCEKGALRAHRPRSGASRARG